jgi:hypothetical protein
MSAAVIHLGFDPGTSGAVAMLTPAPDWRCEPRDLPIYTTKGRLREVKHVDAAKLELMLHGMLAAYAERIRTGAVKVEATIEDVFTIPGMGTSSHSSDSLVESRVTCENVCRMLGIAVERVRPQTWQRFYGLKGGDKRLSVGTADRLYPAAGLKLVKHHNLAEAVLIAHWARRMKA